MNLQDMINKHGAENLIRFNPQSGTAQRLYDVVNNEEWKTEIQSMLDKGLVILFVDCSKINSEYNKACGVEFADNGFVGGKGKCGLHKHHEGSHHPAPCG